MVFSTYWAGAEASVNGITTDVIGNSYAVGHSAGLLLTSHDAYQPNYAGGQDAFISKFDPQGNLSYASYLGGISFDFGNAIAVDSVGDGYIAGYTASIDFPVSQDPFQPTLDPGDGGLGNAPEDAFVAKFPLGGSGTLSIIGILPNAGGNAGSVTAQIIGTGFHAGAAAKLACGQSNVPGQNTTISGGGQILAATYDLTHTVPGACDVTVTNPDMNSVTLPQSFTVQQGGAANIQVSVVGTLAIKPLDGPTPVTYSILVSNTGNIDSSFAVVPSLLESDFTVTSVTPAAVADVPTLNGARAIAWTLPYLAAKDEKSFSYSVYVSVNTAPGSPLEGGPSCPSDDFSFASFLNAVGNAIISPCGQAATCFIAGGIACTAAGATPAGPAVCGSVFVECLPLVIQCSRSLPGYYRTYYPIIEDDLNNFSRKLFDGCESFFSTLQGRAYDPNYLAGPNGVGTAGWINGSAGLPYVVSFGNDPNASAAAQEVIVTQPLDPNINVLTLRLNMITIPNLTNPIILITIPPGSFNPAVGINEFTTSVDLRPIQNLFVTVDAKLNTSTNTITWTFNSIDPTTGLPPTNPLIGILPPGANAAVSCAAKPRQGLTTGTQISEEGSVVFNTNPPINTNIWTNRLDSTAPVSQVSPLSNNSVCQDFQVQWTGSDSGSGIRNFTVYASDNGAPFAPWLTNTAGSSGVYNGTVGHTYGFYSIARDQVGNIEPGKSSAEATTTVTGQSQCMWGQPVSSR